MRRPNYLQRLFPSPAPTGAPILTPARLLMRPSAKNFDLLEIEEVVSARPSAGRPRTVPGGAPTARPAPSAEPFEPQAAPAAISEPAPERPQPKSATVAGMSPPPQENREPTRLQERGEAAPALTPPRRETMVPPPRVAPGAEPGPTPSAREALDLAATRFTASQPPVQPKPLDAPRHAPTLTPPPPIPEAPQANPPKPGAAAAQKAALAPPMAALQPLRPPPRPAAPPAPREPKTSISIGTLEVRVTPPTAAPPPPPAMRKPSRGGASAAGQGVARPIGSFGFGQS